ncbi:6-bladed beta-propeller [Parabacteroides johnsonii]
MIKTIFWSIPFVLLTLSTSCSTNSGQKEATLPIFDMETAIGKHIPDTFTWNSIAEHITYLPIASTSDDVILGSAQLVYCGKDFHGVVDHKTNTIFLIDQQGNVIRSISKKGQGPGEYSMITYVHIQPQESTIRVFDQRGNKYIIYDLEGNLQQEIFLKEKKITTPLFISDHYTVAKGQNNATHKLYVTDKELNIRESLFPIDTALTEMEQLYLTWQLNFCRNRDEAILHYANEDTVFAVNEAGIQPLCIFKKGKYRLTDEEAKKPMEITEQGSPYLRSFWLSSIPGYYLVTYMRENRFYDEIWSRADHRILSRFSNENGEWGLPLCLPSGKKVRLNSRNLYINGNTVATFIDALTASDGQVPGVREEDNPVLIILTLGESPQ